MSRVAIDDTGRWFDSEKAQTFEESKWFDGNNMVSLATRQANCFQTLYRTASGAWVIYSHDYYQGSADTYTIVSDKRAAAWLIVNEHDPKGFDATIRELMLALEV